MFPGSGLNYVLQLLFRYAYFIALSFLRWAMMVPFFVDVNPATVDIKRFCHLDIVAALIVVSHVNDRFINSSFSDNINEINRSD